MWCGGCLLRAFCVFALRCVAKIVMVEWQNLHDVLCVHVCASCVCAGNRLVWLDGALFVQTVSACSFFCVSSVQFVCACVLLFLAWPAGSSWARVLLGSCVFLWRSVVALRGVVWVVHDGRGDGTQKWHVVWGLLAACVLRFCVALRCENRNG